MKGSLLKGSEFPITGRMSIKMLIAGESEVSDMGQADGSGDLLEPLPASESTCVLRSAYQKASCQASFSWAPKANIHALKPPHGQSQLLNYTGCFLNTGKISGKQLTFFKKQRLSIQHHMVRHRSAQASEFTPRCWHLMRDSKG